MGLFKRGSVWFIDFTTPSGQRIKKSARTTDRKEAQELHDRLKAEAWRRDQFDERPERTWEEAALAWLDDRERSDNGTLSGILRWLTDRLEGKKLSAINASLIGEITAQKRKEGVTPATVNKYLMVLRAVLRHAHSLGWIPSSPRIRILKTETKRVRYLTKDEATRLIAVLPDHKADIVRFSLATGLRMRNVLGLTWSQVDMGRRVAWIHPDQAKARRAISVPLSDEAVDVIRKQLGKCDTHVFSFNGKPIQRVNNRGWQNALKKAGIKDFRWHDLRHTWASWHIQNGTPLSVLQELGGWESVSMVKRYAHLSGEHLQKYAGNGGRVPNTSQQTLEVVKTW
ncbi:integrase [Leptospirillum ferriphilum]|nr:site-specific integrase [Leptospirillum ferriphilum]OOH80753.1 integrase [Leptospirillum ferriphilum]